jgi:acyl-CoA thioesterase II
VSLSGSQSPRDAGTGAIDLADAFDLEVAEVGATVSRFVGRNLTPDPARRRLYGGQVAAQALIAAGLTVPDGRRAHSLHGYFLRSGDLERKVEYVVDHDRDGRRFSARHVSAMQDDRVIFSMLASFCEGTPRTVLDEGPYRPDRIPPLDACPGVILEGGIESRPITKVRVVGERTLYPDAMYMRPTTPIPDSDLHRAALLVYVSDLGSGFGQNEDDDVGVGDVSLDHAVWFHQLPEVGSWLVLDSWPIAAVYGRGLYNGSIRDLEGRLAATVTQETLLRYV